MKKACLFFAFLFLLGSLIACTKSADSLQEPGYATQPYFNAKESNSPLRESRIIEVLARIPSNQYEPYPSMQNIPLSATLYKDGQVISIDVLDPRLIRLVNFFNNSLYYEKCAYIQGYLSPESLNAVTAEPFRLELTYAAYGETNFGPYEANTTLCDTIIITNTNNGGFYLINHDLTAYSGEYPVLAAGYTPLFNPYPWLTLFGF